VRGLIFALLAASATWGCATDVVYDDGAGPVNARGRSVENADDRNPGDLEVETESNTEATEEESIYDAVEESDL
jgi:malate synthase